MKSFQAALSHLSKARNRRCLLLLLHCQSSKTVLWEADSVCCLFQNGRKASFLCLEILQWLIINLSFCRTWPKCWVLAKIWPKCSFVCSETALLKDSFWMEIMACGKIREGITSKFDVLLLWIFDDEAFWG